MRQPNPRCRRTSKNNVKRNLSEDTIINFDDIKLRIYPHPDLRITCDLVKEDEFGTFELEAICQTMLSVMRNLNGLGLAANQVGINKRIFVYENTAHDEDEEEPKFEFPEIFINPQINETDNTTKGRFREGCLSFPSCYPMVDSATNYELIYYDLQGEKHVLTDDMCFGLYGAVFHHEISHLNGNTLIDRVNMMDKDKILKKMNKIREKI